MNQPDPEKPARESEVEPRKPYAPPHLTAWGSIEDITLGLNGLKNEPGSGNTVRSRF